MSNRKLLWMCTDTQTYVGTNYGDVSDQSLYNRVYNSIPEGWEFIPDWKWQTGVPFTNQGAGFAAALNWLEFNYGGIGSTYIHSVDVVIIGTLFTDLIWTLPYNNSSFVYNNGSYGKTITDVANYYISIASKFQAIGLHVIIEIPHAMPINKVGVTEQYGGAYEKYDENTEITLTVSQEQGNGLLMSFVDVITPLAKKYGIGIIDSFTASRTGEISLTQPVSSSNYGDYVEAYHCGELRASGHKKVYENFMPKLCDILNQYKKEPVKALNHSYETVDVCSINDSIYLKDYIWHNIDVFDEPIVDPFGELITRCDTMQILYKTPLDYYTHLGADSGVIASVTAASNAPQSFLFPYAPLPYVDIGGDTVIARQCVPYPSGFFHPRDFVETFNRGLESNTELTDASKPVSFGEYYPNSATDDSWKASTFGAKATAAITTDNTLLIGNTGNASISALCYGNGSGDLAFADGAIPNNTFNWVGVDTSRDIIMTIRTKVYIHAQNSIATGSSFGIAQSMGNSGQIDNTQLIKHGVIIFMEYLNDYVLKLNVRNNVTTANDVVKIDAPDIIPLDGSEYFIIKFTLKANGGLVGFKINDYEVQLPSNCITAPLSEWDRIVPFFLVGSGWGLFNNSTIELDYVRLQN